MRVRLTAALAIGALGVASAVGYWAGQNNLSGDGPAIVPEAQAASSEAASGERSPTKPYPNRDVYYPGTEELMPDEMRVITCGSGMTLPHDMARLFLTEQIYRGFTIVHGLPYSR